MIQVMDNIFALHTEHTTYLFAADESGQLFHLYYGAAIPVDKYTVQSLWPRITNPIGCAIITDEHYPALCLDDICLEVSGKGQGDMREPFVDLEFTDGRRGTDFLYENYEISSEKLQPEQMPGSILEYQETASESLVLRLKDRNSGLILELVYSVFEECDCITRFARIINTTEEQVKLHRMMSAQLDVSASTWKILSFQGDWAREMQKTETVLQHGKYICDSLTGFSSNKSNPFVIFGSPEMTETTGEGYACNLIYSGNHRECFESGGHGKLRMLTGIHPDTFCWNLQPGEHFDSPEAVMTWTDQGYEGISLHMHSFVREHIVRGKWQKKERPVLINSWEAMYFEVQEKRLLKLAKDAKAVGIELFVLDDGWFGKRDNDTCSLGDWKDNEKKLPGGLKGLSEKLHKMGLQFGIWMEPEMVNRDSELFQEHPDWAVCIPGQQPAEGRHQLLLDLTREEVRSWMVETISDVLRRGNVDYVKWDMNRHMSDYYSQSGSFAQGEFAHRYILGLYQVLEAITSAFPDVLFEACASGGNRFDLGMLCYMPQIWASDNTDAICRAVIQNGYSYGYPQSVIGAHVSGCPNHQTLRETPLETRFAVAAAGILGYECNLSDAKPEELEEIKREIELYKKWRSILQFGQLYRLDLSGSQDIVRWNIVSAGSRNAVAIRVQGQCQANLAHQSLRLRGMDDSKVYRLKNRMLKFDIHRMGDLVNTLAPIHIRQDSLAHDMLSKFVKLDGEKETRIVSGRVLNQAGIQLAESYSGTGFGDNTAIYQDYDSRMYFMKAVTKKQ